MADKFLLELSSQMPLFYASNQLGRPEEVKAEESYSQSLLRGGLFRAGQKYFSTPKQQSDIRIPNTNDPISSISHMRSEQQEFPDAQFREYRQEQDTNESNVGGVTQAQTDQVFNILRQQQQAIDNEEANRLGQRGHSGFDPIVDDISGFMDNLTSRVGVLDLFLLTNGIQALLNKDGKKPPKLAGGVVRDLPVEQKVAYNEYEESLPPVKDGCRRFTYFDGRNQLKSFTLCSDGYMSMNN